MNKYSKEVKERWSETNAYKEHEEKTKDYTQNKWEILKEKMDEIFKEFSICLKMNMASNEPEVLSLVEKLQTFITNNFYTCTKQILLGLANMYVCDNRFKEFIDKYQEGTSLYVLEAVKYYCK